VGSTILVRTLDLRLLESVSDSAMFADAEPPATFNFIIGLVVLFLRVKELQPRALLEHRRHPRYRGRDALLSRISATGHPSSHAEINGCHSLVKGHSRPVLGIQYQLRVALIVRVTLTPKGAVVWRRC
jgi:hypothetical protein